MKKLAFLNNVFLKRFLILFIAFSSLNVFSQTVYDYAVDGKIIFQLKPEKSKSEKNNLKNAGDIKKMPFLSAVRQKYGIEKLLPLHPNSESVKLANTYEVTFTEIYKVDEFIQYLNSQPEVEYAEYNFIHKPHYTPNDPYYTSYWMWHLFKINAGKAWDIARGSKNIVVAVLDCAFEVNHPDLKNVFIKGRDIADEDDDVRGYGKADAFHGTHVSGIVGAETDNKTGIASIGFGVSIMPVKVARDVDGVITTGYQAIAWAADNGADVINMSWGASFFANYGKEVVEYAYGKGCVLVASAGNDGKDVEVFPAAFDKVIAVASTSYNDKKSSFSQYGYWINVCAPGAQIYSVNSPSGYAFAAGTSMASPLVAGLVGLMKSLNPKLKNYELIDILYRTCDNIDNANPNLVGKLGAGRINAYKAVLMVKETMLNYDLGVDEIIQPSFVICTPSSVNVKVKIKNYGIEDINKAQIKYQWNDEESNLIEWNGNVSRLETFTIELPEKYFEEGVHTLKLLVYNPNDFEDENKKNDSIVFNFRVFNQLFLVPFYEDFESLSLELNKWTINYQGNNLLEVTNAPYYSKNNYALRGNFFSNQNAKTALISPPFNISMMGDLSLSFEHAYRKKGLISDTLKVYVSTDCGNSFEEVIKLFDSKDKLVLSTLTPSENIFVPTQMQDWCSEKNNCIKLNLEKYLGNRTLIFKFEMISSTNGNNLYVDNINLEGSILSESPDVVINASRRVICKGDSVIFTDLSQKAVVKRKWFFEGGSPQFSSDKSVVVKYQEQGYYNVLLEATNNYGTSTKSFENFIYVSDYPEMREIKVEDNYLIVDLLPDEKIQWYWNNISFYGDTLNRMEIKLKGNYHAEIINKYNCSITTSKVYAEPTFQAEFENNEYLIYPNPAVDFIKFLNDNNLYDVQIYNHLGQLVIKSKTSDFIDVSFLEQGLYFLKATTTNKVYLKKLLIIK